MRWKTVLGSTIAGIGVLLVAAAAILYWGVYPAQAKLPGDTDTTRQYAGTAKLLVQPQALAIGDQAHAVVTNAPITAARTVKVMATDGNAAEVNDARTLTTASGQPVGSTNVTYAVDRKSLEATTSHPADWNVTPHQGLSVSWPIGAGKQNYTGWVNEVQATTPITYVREEVRNGITTYVYEVNSTPAPIKNPQVLATLPKSLPGSALSALGAALPIPDQTKAQLAQLLPQLTQPAPISYTYQLKATYWVEPTTGTVVDVAQEEIRQAGLALPGVGATPSLPVYDVVTQNTPASVSAATTDANHNANKILGISRVLPLSFLVIGVLAIVGGVMLAVMGRRTPRPSGAGPAHAAG